LFVIDSKPASESQASDFITLTDGGGAKVIKLPSRAEKIRWMGADEVAQAPPVIVKALRVWKGSPLRPSISNHAIHVSFFEDQWASKISRTETTLPELAERIGAQTAAEKAALPWLKLARFGDTPSAKNCLRYNANVRSLSGVEVEHDACTMTFSAAVEVMQQANIRCLGYTSPSWIEGTKEKWRFLLPLSTEHPPEARAGLVARANGVLGGVVSDECFVLSQSFYFGHVDGAAHREVVLDGDFIDQREDLVAGAIGKRKGDGAGPGKGHHHEQQGDFPCRSDDEIMALVQQSRQLNRFGERQWHLSMLSATGSMIWQGWMDEEIYDATADYCDRGWGDKDIEVMIRGGRAKWEIPDPAEELSVRLGEGVLRLLRERNKANGGAETGAGNGAEAGASSAGADDGAQAGAGTGADDGAKAGANDGAKAGAAPGKRHLAATPYAWIDPAKLPQRSWLYGRLLIRKFVSMSVAPGGTGKTSLITTEALAQVSGRSLIGVTSSGRLRVWLWNLEDPLEETQRKLQAAAKHYGLGPEDIGDRLFVDSGRDQKLVIAIMTRNGPTIVRPVVDALIEEVIAKQIEVIVVDPFVSCHETPENDNNAADMVVKQWAVVADRGNCAVHLIDHTRKAPAGTEVTTDSARGGKAKTDGARVVRVVNQMSKGEGEKAGVQNHRLYFRTYNDKGNLAPPAETSEWFELKSVPLGNGPAVEFNGNQITTMGDSVGVVVPWQWPDPLEGVDNFDAVAAEIMAGVWRENSQCKDWVGVAVAKALGLNLDDPAARDKVKGLIKVWTGTKRLVTVTRKDNHREERKFIEVAAAEG
jgi:hypothetical protein